ncbi:MAG: YbaY family lipoprotein [Undibacterium sp.]|nr:YbaY family lipoprotein [Opitutaceae bacterium]
MKTPIRLIALLVCTLVAGCGHLEMTPESDPNRVVTGTVNLRMPTDLPADASVLVRVVEGARGEATLRVLGEQAITRAGEPPVAYRVEFRADDALLRRGVNIEARVSFGGQLRYYNFNAIGLNAGNIDRPLVLVVDPVKR